MSPVDRLLAARGGRELSASRWIVRYDGTPTTGARIAVVALLLCAFLGGFAARSRGEDAKRPLPAARGDLAPARTAAAPAAVPSVRLAPAAALPGLQAAPRVRRPAPVAAPVATPAPEPEPELVAEFGDVPAAAPPAPAPAPVPAAPAPAPAKPAPSRPAPGPTFDSSG